MNDSPNQWYLSGDLRIEGRLSKLDVGDENTHAFIRAHDFWMGHKNRHGNQEWQGRALVDLGETLNINYGPDWKSVNISGNVDIGSNPLRFSSGWTGSPDAVANGAEISNDTNGFKTLMIVGNKSAGMGRRVSVWDRLEVNGDLTVTNLTEIGSNPLRFSSSWTASTDAGSNRAEISNDTGEYKTLMIVGNNSAGRGRRVSVWDRLEVNGDLTVTNLTEIGSNPLRFSSSWTASTDAGSNRAEISNDTGGYKTLMIVGNNSAGRGRRVSVWDRLEVNGELTVTGNLVIGGSITYGGQLNKLDVAEGDGFAYIRAHDLLFGHSSRRSGMGRALVDDGNKLFINFERDWKNVVIPGFDVLSTREVKTNIKPLAEDVAFRIIRELNPVTYNHKRWPDELPRLGFIAEDVPDEIASDDHKAIRPDNIIAVLTKVVQNQQIRIEILEKQVLSYEQCT